MEEVDAHQCYRCHAIIIGLDKYVKHRETECMQSTPHNLMPNDEEATRQGKDGETREDMEMASLYSGSGDDPAFYIKKEVKEELEVYDEPLNQPLSASNMNSSTFSSYGQSIQDLPMYIKVKSDPDYRDDKNDSEENKDSSGFDGCCDKSGNTNTHAPDDFLPSPELPSGVEVGMKRKCVDISVLVDVGVVPQVKKRGRGRPRKNESPGIKITKKSNANVTLSRVTRSRTLTTQTIMKDISANDQSNKDASGIDNIDTVHDVKQLYVDNDLSIIKAAMKDKLSLDKNEVQTAVRATSKLLCPVCKVDFSEAYTALHFASLAHVHNELQYRQNRNEEIDSSFNKMLLQNFNAIVKTSPFMCRRCKFYCNLHEDLVIHMKTHRRHIEDGETLEEFFCSACPSKGNMGLLGVLCHLQTPLHLLNARNNVLETQQVVISSRAAVEDPPCDGNSRPEIEALVDISHNNSYINDEDDLPSLTHSQDVLHQSSAKQSMTLEDQGKLSVSVAGTCRLCYAEVDDLSTLRQHMSEEHQKDCTPCHHCGVVLLLWIDTSQHHKQGMCSGAPGPGILSGKFKCDQCYFRNDMLAHVLMHKTLVHGQQIVDGRHVCHLCETNLLTYSVKGHMLNHSNEWPHTCHLCSRKFRKQEWLKNHLSAAHASKYHSKHTLSVVHVSTCGKTLYSSANCLDATDLCLPPKTISNKVSSLQKLWKSHLIS